MNQALVDAVVNAVLYEGYVLYPYRPSVKNRQRWTFGGLFPREYSEAQAGSDAWATQTECLAQGDERTTLRVKVRFLHLLARTVGELERSGAGWPDGQEPAFRPVESLRVGEDQFHSWQEAVEREVDLGEVEFATLQYGPRRSEFSFAGRREIDPVRDRLGAVGAVLVREQQPVAGVVEASAEPAAEGLFRVRVRVENLTPPPDAGLRTRDEALLRSLASTHTILGVGGGEFVSLLDPPGPWREPAARCRNVGAWPVLVGEAGTRDTVLASPIILYDYPQIAPQSPGDLFDGTEIDEILTLRILTLTDEEKRAAAAVDERVRTLLSRTEVLARDQLLGLHGTIRGPAPTGAAPRGLRPYAPVAAEGGHE
jgi:hydrogenase maturation protease